MYPGAGEDNRKSQLRSRPETPSGGNVVYRMNTATPPKVTTPDAPALPDLLFRPVFSTPPQLKPVPVPKTTAPPTTTPATTTTTTTTTTR